MPKNWLVAAMVALCAAGARAGTDGGADADRPEPAPAIALPQQECQKAEADRGNFYNRRPHEEACVEEVNRDQPARADDQGVRDAIKGLSDDPGISTLDTKGPDGKGSVSVER